MYAGIMAEGTAPGRDPTKKCKSKKNMKRGKKAQDECVTPAKTCGLLSLNACVEIEIAKAGDPAPLKEYIDNFDLDRAKSEPMTNAQ